MEKNILYENKKITLPINKQSNRNGEIWIQTIMRLSSGMASSFDAIKIEQNVLEIATSTSIS